MTSKSVNIPDSDELRAIRRRIAERGHRVLNQGESDRIALMALVDDLVSQAREGVFVSHDCPAMFACAYIIAQCDAPEAETGAPQP